jgi:hypothetical protein
LIYDDKKAVDEDEIAAVGQDIRRPGAIPES